MIVTRHLHISGRVQGVGFRFHMRHRARELGITGWVRNRAGGGVEAVVQGTPDAVEAITAWARHGPPAAVVVDVKIAAGDGDYAEFSVRPSE